MNILICDDIKSDAKNLEQLIASLNLNTKVTLFESGHDVLSYIRSGVMIDLCFLDILMPDMDGITLAQNLRLDGYKGNIIFLTASNDYAFESYAVHAFSYLLKPPVLHSIRDVLLQFEDSLRNEDTKGIWVNSKDNAEFVHLRDIVYVEVVKHHVHFHLQNGNEVSMYGTLKEASALLLCDSRFAQTHRSFIVNIQFIKAVSLREIALQDSQKIPISKNYCGARRSFAKWVIG